VRGTIEDLATPHPLGYLLPGLYHDNDIAQRFTGALDVVLAPVLGTLDSSDAYVDPRLAPLDFVEWLAEWVGVELDASWPEGRQRALVHRAAELFAWRGTVRGVAEAVAIYTGAIPEILESGATAWTGTPPPTGELPGSPAGGLIVRVRVPAGEGQNIDLGRLDRLVEAAKPAHIAHRVEIHELAPVAPAPVRRARASGARKAVERAPDAAPPAEPPAEAPATPATPTAQPGRDLDGEWPEDHGIQTPPPPDPSLATGRQPTEIVPPEDDQTEPEAEAGPDAGPPAGPDGDGG
jgi:phage tail-like protein